MYLPLTGYKDKEDGVNDMSINSIGASLATRMVQPSNPAPMAQQETQKVNTQPPEQKPASVDSGEDKKSSHHGNLSCSNTMSTQDFLLLRTQANEDPYAVLDEVIARMKDNMEQLGDALEAFSKMSEQTDESKIALQLLQETFDAVDEIRSRK